MGPEEWHLRVHEPWAAPGFSPTWEKLHVFAPCCSLAQGLEDTPALAETRPIHQGIATTLMSPENQGELGSARKGRDSLG